MLINKQKLNKDSLVTLKNYIDKNLFKTIFKESNLWIAGGFARKLFQIQYKDKFYSDMKPVNQILNGDVDFFFKDKKTIERICFDIKYKFSNVRAEDACFAINVFSNRKRQNLYPQIQLINSFMFNSYKECFDSFDFEICKFGIIKEKEDFYFVYTEKAEKDLLNREINISNARNPFLVNRIRRYKNLYDFRFDTSKNINKIKEFILLVFKEEWSDFFLENKDKTRIKILIDSCLESQLKTIDQDLYEMSSKELIYFIGKYIHREVRYDSNYQYYCEAFHDWASYKLRLQNEKRV